MPALIILYWRWLLIAALAAALAVQTYRLKALEHEYERYVLEVEALGNEALARAEAENAHHQLVNEELEHDIAKEREARARERKVAADRFGGLYGKYFGLLNAEPGGGGLSETSTGAAEPLRAERVCFDADGLRASLERLHGELEPRAGEVAAWWGKWARLSGACPAP